MKLHRLFWLLVLIGPNLCRPSFADSDFQKWYGVFVEAPLGGDFRGFAEVQNRTWRNASTERQLLARAALGYAVSERHTLWLGYGWTPLFSPSFQDEHRLWQQSWVRYKWDEWSLSFRFRLEERWLPNGGTAWRWREQIRAALRLNELFSAVVWDEFFFNLNTTNDVKTKGFQQNRFFIGTNVMLGKGFTLDLGYLPVFQKPNQWSHVAATYLMFNP